MKQTLCLLGLLSLFATTHALADQTLQASRVAQAPVVDGNAQDPEWAAAKALVTRDRVAKIDITLKAIYTADEIFFLLRFPDTTENRVHKMLQWDKEMEIYKPGPTREDAIILKWSMEPLPVDLSLTSEQPYKADIWYWKSYRTGHAGYADDKYQIYSNLPLPKSKRLLSGEGNTFYLIRKGDAGQSAYQGASPIEYQGEETPAYKLRKPSGSRADVRAKGQWNNGFWSVEFSRKLVTGHHDDVALEAGRSYRFGVSRYEIAGRKAESDIENPLFGAGDIGEHLMLQLR
ncbi:MAG: ethylbenzene dehydrogenase-related protein [Pseudomonadota bacterium]